MSSRAKRRSDRMARKRRVRQVHQKHERIADELRNRWGTQIVSDDWVLSDLRVVNAPRIGKSNE